MIIIGGFNGRGTLSSVEKFDVVLNEWKTLQSMKFARMDFGAFYYAKTNSIYVLGGLSTNVESNVITSGDGTNVMTNLSKVNNIERYSIDQNEW